MTEERLLEAAERLRAGDREGARALLARYLQTNPRSDRAWFLLSQALEDREKQIECLRRALALNPGHEAARERLAELQGERPAPPRPAPPPPARPTPPPPRPAPERSPARPAPGPPRRRRPTWITLLVVLFLLLGLAGVGLAGTAAVRQVQRMNATSQALEATERAEVAAAVATAGGSLDLPPTWTPSPTATVTLTPTITPTPTVTPTPTLPAPNPTVLADMDRLQTEVADVRGLEVRSQPARFLLPKSRIRPVLESLFLTYGGSRQQVEDEARVLSALGLIKPTYDLYTNTLNSLSDGIGGFYSALDDQVFVIGVRFGGVERWIFAHEFGHALVDQHFDLGAFGVYPLCLLNEDRCAAIRALVEGDATLVAQQWWFQYAGPQDYQDILNYRPPPFTLPEQFPPPAMVEDSEFPYQEGYDFVRFLHDRGNWAEVNRAYARLPESTEHILHPQKYLAGEAPRPVDLPDLGPTLGPGWRRLSEGVLGEWRTYLLLGHAADLAAQLDLGRAAAAAAGWGGDRMAAYYHDEGQKTVLVVRWAWDTAADAREFESALRDHLTARYRNLSAPDLPGTCWSGVEQVSCIYLAGDETLWLLAPDGDLLRLLLAQFPAFGSP